MYFSRATAVLSLVPLVVATACTQSNAIDYAPSSSPGSDPCANACGNDSACLQECYAEAEQGQCNAVGCPDTDKRSTFTCASDETCYRYTDGSLFCLNIQTGEYVDDVGGHGNADTGIYTSANGGVTTNLGDGTESTTRGAATATDTSQDAGWTTLGSATATDTSQVAGWTTLGAATTSDTSQVAKSTFTTLPTITKSGGASRSASITSPSPTKSSGAEGRHIEIWAIGASSLFAAFCWNIMY